MAREKQIRKKTEPHRILRTRVGKTLTEFKTNKIEYSHFDDHNEDVDRLCLLLSSQSAGNTNHNNEIISIMNNYEKEALSNK